MKSWFLVGIRTLSPLGVTSPLATKGQLVERKGAEDLHDYRCPKGLKHVRRGRQDAAEKRQVEDEVIARCADAKRRRAVWAKQIGVRSTESEYGVEDEHEVNRSWLFFLGALIPGAWPAKGSGFQQQG